jgi:hypothetical protein
MEFKFIGLGTHKRIYTMNGICYERENYKDHVSLHARGAIISGGGGENLEAN